MVLFATLFNNAYAVGFSRTPNFLESVFFLREMLGVTNFGIVLSMHLHCQCGDFYQQICCKFTEDQSFEIVKYTRNNHFERKYKNILLTCIFFFKWD